MRISDWSSDVCSSDLDYCDWCDRFYWALAAGLDPAILGTEGYRPETSGLIVADRYGAAVVREAASCHLAPARRKAELLRIGRMAKRRAMLADDPARPAGVREGERSSHVYGKEG